MSIRNSEKLYSLIFDEKYLTLYEALDREISQYIESLGDDPNGTQFNRLALKLFEFQYTYNEPYQKFCDRRSMVPGTVRDWKQIPAIPTIAFKEAEIRSFPATEQVHFLQTSGTSQAKQGKILFNHLGVKYWKLSNRMSAQQYLYPSGKALRALLLVPPLELAPNLGISNAVPNFVLRDATNRPEYFMDSTGLKGQQLIARLEECEINTDPIILIGATFCFVHLMDYMKEKGKTFRLPPGSVISDGGGFKGKSREIEKSEYQSMLMEYFGLPQSHIINMLGMTEFSGVFFENVLKNYHERKSLPRFKENTAWTRTVVIDPDTLEEVPKGQIGLLKHYSLGNISTVLGILTDDVGYAIGDGFEVIGRASKTESRGCSISLDEFINKKGIK